MKQFSQKNLSNTFAKAMDDDLIQISLLVVEYRFLQRDEHYSDLQHALLYTMKTIAGQIHVDRHCVI